MPSLPTTRLIAFAAVSIGLQACTRAEPPSKTFPLPDDETVARIVHEARVRPAPSPPPIPDGGVNPSGERWFIVVEPPAGVDGRLRPCSAPDYVDLMTPEGGGPRT
jgi:hypothetical protein